MEDDEYLSGLHLTSREKRFIKFASVEYNGQLYMTPQDFLESFVDEQPRGIKYIVSKGNLTCFCGGFKKADLWYSIYL